MYFYFFLLKKIGPVTDSRAGLGSSKIFFFRFKKIFGKKNFGKKKMFCVKKNLVKKNFFGQKHFLGDFW